MDGKAIFMLIAQSVETRPLYSRHEDSFARRSGYEPAKRWEILTPARPRREKYSSAMLVRAPSRPCAF